MIIKVNIYQIIGRPTMMINMIRRANKKDFLEVVDVLLNDDHPFNKKFNETKKSITGWYKSKFFDPNNETYIFKDGKTAGFVTLRKSFPAYRSCEITNIGVHRNFQGKGIGSKLLKFIEKCAKALKFERIFLYTSQKNNTHARHFYEKNSYKKINTFPGFYGFGENAVLYEKRLK